MPKSPAPLRIGAKLQRALIHIAETDAKIGDAASHAGMTYEGLRVALQRPHVRSRLRELKRDWLSMRRDSSFHTMDELRQTAASESVRLDAAHRLVGHANEQLGDIKREGGLHIHLPQPTVIEPRRVARSAIPAGAQLPDDLIIDAEYARIGDDDDPA